MPPTKQRPTRERPWLDFVETAEVHWQLDKAFARSAERGLAMRQLRPPRQRLLHLLPLHQSMQRRPCKPRQSPPLRSQRE